MAYKNFSKKSRLEKDFAYDDFSNENSHDPAKDKRDDLNKDEWVKFIAYYRKYPDKFATDILNLKLYMFQRLILRAMARNQYTMLICCRGNLCPIL